MSVIKTVSLIGFGEVGQTLAEDLAPRDELELRAWDVLFDDAASRPARAIAGMPGVERADSAVAAATGAQLILSAVTADNSRAAAESVSAAVDPDAWYVDVNSVSPARKVEVAETVSRAGGRFVEVAIMSSIAPLRIASPMLLGGPDAATFAPLAQSLGFDGASVYSRQLGKVSATKMCRSVVVKGLESLLAEALQAARSYGVEADVVDSLRTLVPDDDWETLARYMIARSIKHGVRRAEEMREVALTVAEAGIKPLMSSACAQRQALSAEYAALSRADGLPQLLDGMLEQERKEQKIA